MATAVYDPATNNVVANGDEAQKVNLHWEVPNCLPLNGPVAGERYTLRTDQHGHISVKCIAPGAPGIQTASFMEV